MRFYSWNKVLLTSNKEIISYNDYYENTGKYIIIGIVVDPINRLAMATEDSVKRIHFDEGIKFAASYKTPGTNEGDWRLPTKSELEEAFVNSKNRNQWLETAIEAFNFQECEPYMSGERPSWELPKQYYHLYQARSKYRPEVMTEYLFEKAIARPVINY